MTAVDHKTGKRFLFAGLVFWGPVILFCAIAAAVLAKGPLFFDNSLLHWIHGHATPLYDSVFLDLTTIGSVEILGPIILATSIYLWYKRQRCNLLIVIFSVAGAGLANVVLKYSFHRQRPSLWHSAVTETGYSFPSAHAMLSCAFAASVVVILWKTRWRWWSVGLGGLLCFGIGFSRLYLGVHYPSDVVAGWSAAIAWVAVVVSLARRYSKSSVRRNTKTTS